jgi:hypothetical protein
LGEIRALRSRTVEVRVRVDADLSCGDGQFVAIHNRARVVNLAGPDPRRRDNRARTSTDILCRTVEYAAKILCGTQQEPDDLLLTRGAYATTVNVHNPNDETVFFFKKLALSFPPEAQEAGRIHPIGIDQLDYDEALKTDCNDLRLNVFDGELPASYIEGFVVLQGVRSLDVVGVYTAAALDAQGNPSAQSGIHLETVTERRFEIEGADLEIRKSATAEGSPTIQLVRYTIEVTNHGPLDATNVVVEDSLDVAVGALVQIFEGSFSASHGGEWTLGPLTADSAELEAAIASLPANETATLEFALEVRVEPPVVEMRLVNTAQAASELSDPNPQNDSVRLETVLP